MTAAPPSPPLPAASRRFAISEFAANWMTHGLGLVLALVGAPLLVVLAVRVGTPAHVAACVIYGLTLILLYASSTNYHVRQDKPGDFRRLVADHICIYLLIAGTYTPILPDGVLRGRWGWGSVHRHLGSRGHGDRVQDLLRTAVRAALSLALAVHPDGLACRGLSFSAARGARRQPQPRRSS